MKKICIPLGRGSRYNLRPASATNELKVYLRGGRQMGRHTHTETDRKTEKQKQTKRGRY